MDFSFIASFASSSASAAAAAPEGVTATAHICSIKPLDKRTLFQLRIVSEHVDLLPMFSQPTVSISIFSSNVPAGLEPMDMVTLEGCHEKTIDDGRTFVNAESIHLLVPMRKVLKAENLAKELVPMPLPEKDHSGRPFMMHITDAPLTYKSVPGLHRVTVRDPTFTWFNKKTNKQERRMQVTIEQRQWLNAAEAGPDAPLLMMRLTIWDRSCSQLIQDMEKWPAIIAANPVPCYVLACANGKYTTASDRIALSTLAVHWDLRSYLESDCLELTLEEVQKLMPKAAATKKAAHPDKDGLINMTEKGIVPSAAKEWRYYALSANRATDAEQLEEPMLLFAAEIKKVKPSAAKKTKTVKALKGE